MKDQESPSLRAGRLPSQKALPLGLLAFLALLGIASMAYATTRGPGIGGDATVYLTSARNLLAGRGLGLIEADGSFRLLPYTPPLYPLLLAFFGLPGFDLVQVARWLSVLLFGATIFLVGAGFFHFTRSSVLSLIAAASLLLSPILARVYAWAMSEPLFLFTGFLGLFLSLEYARSPRRSLLIWAAVCCGLSFLARYLGAAFLVSAALIVLLYSPRPWKKRLAGAFSLGIVGFIPMGVWLVIDLFATRTVASRSLESGATLATRLCAAGSPLLDVFLNWLVPDSWIEAPPYPRVLNQVIWILALLGLILLVCLVLWRLSAASRRARDERWGWILLARGLALVIVVFLLVTLGVYVTTYPPITLDNRMLAPVHVATLLFALCLGGLLVSIEKGRRWLALVAGLACLVFLGSYAYRTPRIVQQTHEAGLGFLMDAYQKSETVQALRALPQDQAIVSNELTQVLFFTARSAYPLQEVTAGQPQDLGSVYGSDASDPSQRAFRSGAALVIFDTIQQQLSDLYGAQSSTRLQALTQGLYEAFHGSDGAIYYYERH